MAITVKRENWKGRYVYVARDNKKILTFQYSKGKDLKLEDYKQLYNNFRSFTRKYSTTREKLKNVELITRNKETEIKNMTKPPITSSPAKLSMYSISGYVGSVQIVANSKQDARISDRKKKDDAWQGFLEKLGNWFTSEKYDADEGIKYLDKVSNLEEGWITFKRLAKA